MWDFGNLVLDFGIVRSRSDCKTELPLSNYYSPPRHTSSRPPGHRLWGRCDGLLAAELVSRMLLSCCLVCRLSAISLLVYRAQDHPVTLRWACALSLGPLSRTAWAWQACPMVDTWLQRWRRRRAWIRST